MVVPPTAFFAYASDSQHRADTIDAAIKAINERSPIKVTSWRQINTGGKIVIQAILNRIRKSEIFMCDITGLNSNVLFELGYAIGLRKRVWLTLDVTKKNSQPLVNSLNIVSGIGYRTYTNHGNIVDQFRSDFAYHDQDAHVLYEYDSWIDQVLNSTAATDLFYIPSSVASEAVTKLIEYFRSLKQQYRRKIVIRDKLEDSYDPLHGYLRNILEANAVIAHLDDTDSKGARENNARCSLIAGMAYGFNRKILFVAPAPFETPFDYRNLLVAYEGVRGCKNSVQRWLSDLLMTRADVPAAEADPELTMLALHIGETVAENEEIDLQNYFVPTAAYAAGTRSLVGVFVGRKGTGKTANLYQLRDHFSQEKRNVVVTIKPVSFRIAAFGRLIEEFFAQPDLASDFVERTWRAIIYAEVAIPLSRLIDEETRFRKMTPAETAVKQHMEKYRSFVESDFAGRIDYIRSLVSEVVGRGDEPKKALHKIAEDLTRPLYSAYQSMFTRYQQVVILVDNLDKAWSIGGQDRSVQTRLILGLLEFQNTITRELSLNEGTIRILVFLREDIFVRVIKDSYEPDKVRLVLQQIVWRDAEQLAEILEKRFVACSPNTAGGSVWDELFCRQVSGVDTKEYLLSHVMPRPRDLIHVVRTAIDNCIGRSHSRIESDDILDALRDYYQFLLDNMITEYGAYQATLRELIQSFSGCDQMHNMFQLWRIVRHQVGSRREFFEAIKFLFRVSFLGVKTQHYVEFAYTNDDADRLLPVVQRGLKWTDFGRTRFVIHAAFRSGLELKNMVQRESDRTGTGP